eukprot:2814042-Rhodomonas_salina.2
MLPSLPPPLTLTRSFAHSCHTNGDKFDMTHSIPLSLAHPQNLLSLLTSSLLSLYSSRSCLLSLLTLSAPSSPSSSSLSSPSHPPSSSSNQHWSTTQRLLAPTLSKANGTPLPDSRHSSCVISHKACLFAHHSHKRPPTAHAEAQTNRVAIVDHERDWERDEDLDIFFRYKSTPKPQKSTPKSACFSQNTRISSTIACQWGTGLGVVAIAMSGMSLGV